MDGSGASGGEGCLGRFRHLRALLVVPWPLIPNIPNSEPELDPKITRFGRSLDGFSSFPAQPRLTSSGGAFHTPVPAAGWHAGLCPRFIPLQAGKCIDMRHVPHRQSKSSGNYRSSRIARRPHDALDVALLVSGLAVLVRG